MAFKRFSIQQWWVGTGLDGGGSASTKDGDDPGAELIRWHMTSFLFSFPRLLLIFLAGRQGGAITSSRRVPPFYIPYDSTGQAWTRTGHPSAIAQVAFI